MLDKNQTGLLSTVQHKKKDDIFSEITVLGDAVLKAQQEIGDLPNNPTLMMADFTAEMQKRADDKGWEAVDKFLDAITAGTADEAKGGWEQLSRNVFKNFDSKWCDQADTGSVDVANECKEIGDATDQKCKTILEGLQEGKKLSCDEWVKHVETKVEPVGWWRVKKELMTISARLDKVAELDGMLP